MKIVQVINLDGPLGGYIPNRITALFDDGTIWEGRAHTMAHDDNRLESFTWQRVKLPSLPGGKNG